MSFETEEFRAFLQSVHSWYGYDFTDYSEASIKRRVTHFMTTHKITNLKELTQVLKRDEDTFELFIQDVSVTVTEMFRDPTFYKALKEKVLKRLATYPFIKIWIAGCATGEEVYSVAILLHEAGLLERSVIYATDINQKSLQHAQEGIYSLAHMKSYTENYLKAGGNNSFSEYFTAKYEGALFNKALKTNVVFSSHNLATDKSFNEFQLIICRNVLIYFNQQLQDKVINLFYESLCPFGILALGSKESLHFSSHRKDFEEIARREKIFIKNN